MKLRFADSSWFLALLGPEDEYHEKATEFSSHMSGKVITTEFVLLEVANFLSAPRLRPRVSVLMRSLEGDPYTSIIPASTALFRSGLNLFLNRPDKGWSLTDCISFVIMQEDSISEALTSDHHFEQAGFVALLRSQA